MEQMATKCPRSRAVIVGAGCGGLAAAKRLAEGPVDVTIIDERNYHLFQPLQINGEPPRSRPSRRSPRVMRRPALAASRRRRESGLRSRATVDRDKTRK